MSPEQPVPLASPVSGRLAPGPALLGGEKPPLVLLRGEGEKGGVAKRQRSALSHSKSSLPFENLDW